MTDNNDPLNNAGKISAFIQRLRQPRSPKRATLKKDFSLLDNQTWTYLQSDKQRLQTDLERAETTGDIQRFNSLKYTLKHYYVVENFFLYLAEQGYSTSLATVTTSMTEYYIQGKYLLADKKNQIPQVIRERSHNSSLYQLYKSKLMAFFSRAEQDGVIDHNPMAPLVKVPPKLVPQNLSSQTQADCLAFKEYLQNRVNSNLLSPGTATRLYNHLLILLHDMELRHIDNPSWPVELDSLFTNPKWIAEWLRTLKNRSICTQSEILTKHSIQIYLCSVRRIYLFLRSEGRAVKNFYNDLKDTFRGDDHRVRFPGRGTRKIDALSEIEEETVIHLIHYLSSTDTRRLRDTALFVTGIDTTIRMDGLNSMQIENVKELKPGIWVCLVRIKRSSKKNVHSLDRLADDQAEWREWYISPRAILAIEQYLRSTGRDWESQGPIWLSNNKKPLSLIRQQEIIRRWLKKAGCTFTRPHVLRHTGIERLINKYRLPIPIVQAVSQHANSTILLKVYAPGSELDAYREVDRALPVISEDTAKRTDLILSVGAKLNELSARISQRTIEDVNFSEAHVSDALAVLKHQIKRLASFLNYEPQSDAIALPLDDYLQIGLVLQALGLSFQQLLGYEPQPQHQVVINPQGRKPRSMLLE